MSPARDARLPVSHRVPPPPPCPWPTRHEVVLQVACGWPLLGRHTEAGFEPSPFGLVVRHYGFQLPHKFLHVRLCDLALAPCGVTCTLEQLPAADVARAPTGGLAPVVDWLVGRTVQAYHRGVDIRGWRPVEGPLWRGHPG